MSLQSFTLHCLFGRWSTGRWWYDNNCKVSYIHKACSLEHCSRNMATMWKWSIVSEVTTAEYILKNALVLQVQHCHAERKEFRPDSLTSRWIDSGPYGTTGFNSTELVWISIRHLMCPLGYWLQTGYPPLANRGLMLKTRSLTAVGHLTVVHIKANMQHSWQWSREI